MTNSIILKDKALNKLFVDESFSILEILSLIEKSGYRIALAVNSKKEFQGIITDYDIRRGIVKHKTLDFQASEIINRSPVTESFSSTILEQTSKMDDRNIEHLPLLNELGSLVALRITTSGFLDHSNTVVIMAGGLGKRLHPLTLDTPKPMLKIGDKPILETILDRFKSQGFKDFVITVNYLSEKIINYFGDGSRMNINIQYIQEANQRGTIGALSDLLKIANIQYPILLTNGDVICTTKYKNIIDFHNTNKFDATVCSKDYSTLIPYGVIHEKNSKLIKIDEKPNLAMSINSGIYTFSKTALEQIPKDLPFDATTLITQLLELKYEIGVHQIQDLWLDIGSKDDLKRFQDYI
jgi:dTDP-glucose pyrophosphorylase